MEWRYRGVVVGMVAYGAVSLAFAAEPLPPGAAAISREASDAIQKMGKTLANDVSFKARTMRVYQDGSGDFLHIVHTVNVITRKPDHLAVNVTGDDGASKLIYDGKEVSTIDEIDNQIRPDRDVGRSGQCNRGSERSPPYGLSVGRFFSQRSG